MDITVMLVGLAVLALFLLPFYFVARSKGTSNPTDDSTHHPAARELNHPKKKKQHA
ncbi:MAG: hypothetical protein ACK4VN_04770 [Bacteroidales bacterium]